MVTYGRVLDSLADPTRREILALVRRKPSSVQEIADQLPVSRPAVSQHLKILKAAGVVTGERSGREVLYRLADHHLAHIVLDAVAHAGEDGDDA